MRYSEAMRLGPVLSAEAADRNVARGGIANPDAFDIDKIRRSVILKLFGGIAFAAILVRRIESERPSRFRRTPHDISPTHHWLSCCCRSRRSLGGSVRSCRRNRQ